MIFTYEQLEKLKSEYLEITEDEHFIFTGKNTASKELKEALMKKDIEWMNIFGCHMIINYEDLKI